MTPKQADKIITARQPVTVRNDAFDETFTAVFVRRDRHLIYSETGGAFERSELRLVENSSSPRPA